MTTRSEQLFAEAQHYIPGGVNSPVRAFRGVGGTPIFFKRGEGAYLYDEDDHRYLDYVGSWGPMIIGHAHPAVVRAVREAVGRGLSFGAPTELETVMARRINKYGCFYIFLLNGCLFCRLTPDNLRYLCRRHYTIQNCRRI